MEKRIVIGAALFTCLCFLASWTGAASVLEQRSLPPSASAGHILRAQPDFGKMTVNFIPNRGQLDQQVAYYILGKDKAVYFGREGVTFALIKANDSRWVVKLDFVGANLGVNPVGTTETGTIISYFRGEPSNWKKGLPTYSRIVYANLWPGIDLMYSGTMSQLKSEFIVHPGADPSRIRLAYRGASSVRINSKGSLVVSAPSGGFEDDVPVAYQERVGERVNVPLAYKIVASGEERTGHGGLGENEENTVVYGFTVGEYDQAKSLVLDPVILLYCGYIGGRNSDYGYGIAADASDNAYITGYTYTPGTAFPVKAGPDLAFNGGSVDAFVAKVNADGTALDYCGYIGGSGDDYAYGIALDIFGNAYVTGYTSSTQSTFPVTVGPDLTHNGGFDAFVAKVNAEGTSLDYCGYIGGSGRDYGRSIAVDGAGCAYITGYTNSIGTSFPVKGGPGLTFNGGTADAFVAKVNAGGTALDYCGYIGGSGNDFGYGIAVDILGNAYITGSTTSTESTFPVAGGPILTHKGLSDAFAAKVSVDGAALDYCGYLGGSGYDVGTSIAVDGSGCAYITGYTSSTESSFPVTAGPDLTHNGGYYDAFVAKLSETGAGITYCGYIGGSGYDAGTGISVDGRGYAYVTGYTSSKEATFPVNAGPGLTHSGSFDAYVAKVDASGKKLLFCGYIGGSNADYGMGIALDADGSGNIYLTGNTYSTGLTFPVTAGPDLTLNGGRDAFAAKINDLSVIVTSPNGGESWHVGFTENITWLTTGKVGNVKIEYSADNGETWTGIADSTENDGTYAWVVPDEVSTNFLVRVSDAENGDPSDTSDAVFTVTNEPIIIVKSPNGGEQWQVGSIHEITWITGGDVGNLKIELSTDSSSTWTTIVDSTENNGHYTWTVPDSVSDLCLIRVSGADSGTPLDSSDAVFSIVSATTPPGTKLGKLNFIKSMLSPFF